MRGTVLGATLWMLFWAGCWMLGRSLLGGRRMPLRMLSRIWSESDLVVAECLQNRIWQGLGPADLAAVTSILVFEARREGVGVPRMDLPGPEISTPPNPANCSIPVARVADMLLDAGSSYEFNGRTSIYPDIRLVYWAGGNPFHHHQDLNRLRRAWQRP